MKLYKTTASRPQALLSEQGNDAASLFKQIGPSMLLPIFDNATTSYMEMQRNNACVGHGQSMLTAHLLCHIMSGRLAFLACLAK